MRSRGLILGVATNDCEFKVSIAPPEFHLWRHIIERCYDEKHKMYGLYRVSSDWLVYSNFRKWFIDSAPSDYSSSSYELNCSLFGNGEYSSDGCVFVSVLGNRNVATLTPNVYFEASRGKFVASISINGKCMRIGRYDSKLDAANAWLTKKIEVIESLPDSKEIKEKILELAKLSIIDEA